MRVPVGLPSYTPDNIDGYGAASAPHLSMNMAPGNFGAPGGGGFDEYDDYDADEFDDVQDIPPGKKFVF